MLDMRLLELITPAYVISMSHIIGLICVGEQRRRTPLIKEIYYVACLT
jgi:hypothetical protein